MRSRSYRNAASKISSSASDETSSRHIQLSGAEPGQEFVADFGPRARRDFAPSMRSEAFGNDLAMPVRYRYILRMLGEVIPERLNVIELLVWREIFKAGRWNAGLRHASSIRPPCDPGVKRHVAQHLTRMRRVVHPPVVITLLSEQVFAPSLQTAGLLRAAR